MHFAIWLYIKGIVKRLVLIKGPFTRHIGDECEVLFIHRRRNSLLCNKYYIII